MRKILIASEEQTVFSSPIPPHVRADAAGAVDDICFAMAGSVNRALGPERTTETAYLYPLGEGREHYAAMARIAAATGKPLILCAEVGPFRNALDTPPEQRRAAMRLTVNCLEVIREAAPGLRVGLYSKLPAWIGLPNYDRNERHRQLFEERKMLLRHVDFICLQAYLQDTGDDDGAYAAWHTDLDGDFGWCKRLGYRRQIMVLLSPYFVTGARQWQYIGDDLYCRILEDVRRRGLTPVIWNPPKDEGWGVVLDIVKAG